MSDLPTLAPPVNPETEAFWSAAKEGRLLVAQCNDCDETYFYPRRRCPHCFSKDTAYVEASGRGEVYAKTVNYQQQPPFDGVEAYVLAYVELEEGPRIVTNVVGVEPDEVEAGMAVEATFDEVDGEDAALVRFEPA